MGKNNVPVLTEDNVFSGANSFTGAQSVGFTLVEAATYDVLATDYIVHIAYTTTAAVTSVTIPTAQVVAGRKIVIKDVDGNANVNNITIDTEGDADIDGADTLVMATAYQAVILYCDGVNWFTM